MLGFDNRTARYTWTVVVIVLALVVLFKIRDVLFLFAIGLFFAYLLWPLFAYLNRRLPGRSRVPALAAIYVVLVGLLILGGFEIGSRVVIEAESLAAKLPADLSKVPPAPKTAPHSAKELKQTVIVELRREIAAHSQEIYSLIPKAAGKIFSAAKILLFGALVPILAFFFLKDGAEMREFFLAAFPPGPSRQRFTEIVADVHVLLAQYMRALFLLVGVAFGVYTLFFSIIKMPYGILVAAGVCWLEFIPIVGPLAECAIIVGIALFSGFGHIVVILVFLAVFRICQDYMISPKILSVEMLMHPLIVILGVLAGAELAGVIGSFLSIPTLAVLRIVYLHFRRKRVVSIEEFPVAQPPVNLV
ncbi:MAG: AI-2E family transporter [Terriglobia bacterium]